jgi:hypothetical protein
MHCQTRGILFLAWTLTMWFGDDLTEFDTRTLKDRRVRPTAPLSRYTIRGRRRTFRRKEDQKRQSYVDRYGSGLLFLLTWVAGLNVLDALLTMMILDDGGWEANPVVRSVIRLYGDGFWIWKFGMVSVPLILLCLHSKFRMVLTIVFCISALMTCVVLYEIHLVIYR